MIAIQFHLQIGQDMSIPVLFDSGKDKFVESCFVNYLDAFSFILLRQGYAGIPPPTYFKTDHQLKD